MKITTIIRKIENRFKNNKFVVVENNVDNQLYFFHELINFYYNFEYNDKILKEYIEPPLQEESIEREFIIKMSKQLYLKFFKKDLYSRRACFVNNYDGDNNHCISYLHFYLRDNSLNLNVYIRSMNFETNFLFDNQTLVLAFDKLLHELRYCNTNILAGNINCHIFSLHKKIKK